MEGTGKDKERQRNNNKYMFLSRSNFFSIASGSSVWPSKVGLLEAPLASTTVKSVTTLMVTVWICSGLTSTKVVDICRECERVLCWCLLTLLGRCYTGLN